MAAARWATKANLDLASLLEWTERHADRVAPTDPKERERIVPTPELAPMVAESGYRRLPDASDPPAPLLPAARYSTLYAT